MKKQKNYQIDPDKFLSRAERKKLLKTCRDREELDLMKGRRAWVVRYALVDLAFYTGLRVGEIAALRIDDLRIESKNPYLDIRNGKGGKRRAVYIDEGLLNHLKDFIEKKKTTLGESVEPDAPLFTGRNGGHCQPITLMKSFKVAIEEAKLPDYYSIHSARHTYATFLLHDTQNLRYVQRQLGHANISMTALYSGILPEENGILANRIVRD